VASRDSRTSLEDRGKKRTGHGNRYTELCVRLTADGGVAVPAIFLSSGVPVLDDEAMGAIRRAQPYPPPPPLLLNQNGIVVFRFGFLYDQRPPVTPCAAPPAGQPAISFGGKALDQLCVDTHVDPATPGGARTKLKDARARAVASNEDLYGPLRAAAPVLVFCATDACRTYFAGPAMRGWDVGPGERAPGATYVAGARTTIIVTRTDDQAFRQLAHELSHVELALRVGGARVPQWFDEGLATFIGGEPECLTESPPRAVDLRAVADRDAWYSFTSRPSALPAIYCQARAEVAAWIERHGVSGVLALLEAVRAGQVFEAVYGPVLTR
jgi:hypothetical protein